MTVDFIGTSHAWQLNEVIALFQRRPELVTKAINQVLSEDAELRWSLVIEMYLDQQISLSKAAELLEMHVVDARKRFLAMGIPLYLGHSEPAEAKAEVNAMRHWFAETSSDDTQ